jgi:IS5 family transposase
MVLHDFLPALGQRTDCEYRRPFTSADGRAEADAALLMAQHWQAQRPGGRITLGADKAYDQGELVRVLREMGVTPHVAQNNRGRRSAIDYAKSQRKRPLIEKLSGWLKPIVGLRKVKLRGLEKVGWLFQFTAAAFNLWRIPKREAAA